MELTRVLWMCALIGACNLFDNKGTFTIPPTDTATDEKTTPCVPTVPCDTDCDDVPDFVAQVTSERARPVFATVDEAVDHALAASAGTVRICPGTHEVSTAAVRTGNALVLEGDGIDATRLVPGDDPGPLARVVEGALSLADLTAEGFEGSGVYVEDGELSLAAARIRATTGSAITVRAPTGATLTLTRSELVGNDAAKGAGGGLDLRGAVTATLRDTLIDGNQAADGAGIAIRPSDAVGGAVFTMEDSTLSNNVAADAGGGLFGRAPDLTLLLEDVDIADNQALQGAGMRLVGVQVVGSGAVTIQRNAATEQGGGVWMVRSQLSGLEILENEAESGGGVFAGSLADATSLPDSTLSDSVVETNEATDGGGLWIQDGETLIVSGGAVRGNEATRYGGGAVLPAGAVLDVRDVDFGRNATDNTDNDVELPEVGDDGARYSEYGANATFVCDGAVGCTKSKP